MVVAGDDGIERKIPLTQIKSVEYADAQPAPPAQPPARRASRARGVLVLTSIPSAAFVTQAGMRVLNDFTSTMHTRQDPMACTSFR